MLKNFIDCFHTFSVLSENIAQLCRQDKLKIKKFIIFLFCLLEKVKKNGILYGVSESNEDKMKQFFNNINSIIIMAAIIIIGCSTAGYCWEKRYKK